MAFRTPWRIGALVAVALLLLGVVATQRAASKPERAGAGVLRGLPQDGITLGAPDAPVTLTAYVGLADLDTRLDAALPAIVDAHVRAGRLKLQLRTLSAAADDIAPGDESGLAARVAQAAGLQDELWPLYRVVAERGTGMLDADELRAMARAVPGLDVRQAFADARTPRVAAAVARADALARAADVSGTPALFVQVGPLAPERLRFESSGQLVRALDRAMTRSSDRFARSRRTALVAPAR